MRVQFRLLGQVEADVDGRRVELGHARQRCVLAVLLVDAGRVVPVGVVLDRVWSDRLPRNARVTLSGYVSRLRRLLAAVPEVGLTRQADGYRLAVDPMTVDLHRFRDLVAQARAATARDVGTTLFGEALALWRGQAFGTLDTPWLNCVRDELAAERLATELDRNDLALEQGQHVALLAELSAGAAAHPWDERLAGQLMLALYRCGRQAEALRHYDELRSRLADEVGIDPSPSLQRLHRRVLTADLTLAPVAGTPAPRQLPAPPGSFVGRSQELAQLDTLLCGAPSTVVISAVLGTAGVGKTALALHWAHRRADEFPDGQLYVNLRGFGTGDSVLSPAEAVRGFLDALGVPPHRIPAGLDAQAALYRSLLAGRRLLVVLDNARDVEQIQSLLPGAPSCLVVVTSRNQLTSLITGQCAHPLILDLLSNGEARELLARRIDPERVAAEPAAVDEIIVRCARLPLALAIVAARAASHPHFPLHTLAAELDDSHGRERLDALTGTDPLTDVRTVFSWSYRTLGHAAARLFRLLGLHPGPDFGAPAAASLTGIPLARIRSLLAELTGAHLLIEHLPGRYNFHDLLRAYAAEQIQIHDTAADRRAATHRMLDHYLYTACAATRRIDPYEGDPIALCPAQAGVVVEEFTDSDRAAAWFTAEHPALLAAVNHAASHGFEPDTWDRDDVLARFMYALPYTWSLAWSIGAHSHQRGHWPELAAAFHTALRAAERIADRRGQAHAHRGLGITHHMQGNNHEANSHFQHALKLYGQLSDHTTEATVHRHLGLVAERLGRPRDALDHARQALALQTGNPVGQGRALNSVGWYHAVLGEYDQAFPYLEQALTLLCAAGDQFGQAAVWDSFGYAHHHLGHYQQAVECYQHAVCLNRDVDNRYCEAETLVHLGDVRYSTGNLALARDAWRQALANLDELDHPAAEEVRTKLTGIR